MKIFWWELTCLNTWSSIQFQDWLTLLDMLDTRKVEQRLFFFRQRTLQVALHIITMKALGFHQNNGISLSKTFPINVTQHFGSYLACVKCYFEWPPSTHAQVERHVLYNEHRPRRPPLDLSSLLLRRGIVCFGMPFIPTTSSPYPSSYPYLILSYLPKPTSFTIPFVSPASTLLSMFFSYGFESTKFILVGSVRFIGGLVDIEDRLIVEI